MNWSLLLSLIPVLLKELPAVTTVVSDITGTLSAASPLTPTSAVGPSQTLMAIQRTLNTFVKPTPPLVVDGLYGLKTEAALATGLRSLGLAV